MFATLPTSRQEQPTVPFEVTDADPKQSAKNRRPT